MSRTRGVRRLSTRAVVLACAGLLVLIVGAFAWIGVRAYLVKGELEALVPVARDLQDAATQRDFARLEQLADDLGVHARNAASLTGDPLWGVASAMPVLGANFAAVHTVSANIDAISGSGIGPLTEVAKSFTGGAGAGLDVEVIRRASGPLEVAASAFEKADAQLTAIHTGDLIPLLADGVSSLRDAVQTASPVVASISRAAAVLPGIFGIDEPRTVLIAMQNPAEPRTGGGIMGSFALLSAVDGHLALVRQAESGEFPVPSSPIRPIPDSTVALYGDVIGRYVLNASMTADFALTGELASAWWQALSGTTPDAVISLDPAVLAALLAVTGPITLADGTQLDAGNLVQTLLVDAYFGLDRDQQTQLQQSVTGAVVAQILTGPIDPLAWIEALRPVVDEGRISLWSAHEDEQELLATGPFAGPAARHADAGPHAFAVYVNDRTAGKMGVFLQTTLGAGSVDCRADGRSDVVVRVVVGNTAPPEAVDFPWWVSGGGLEGVPAGAIGADVTVAAPPGMLFGGVTQDGVLVLSTNVEDVGFPSSLAAVTIPAGETTTLEFRFVAADAGDVIPTVLAPPLMNAATIADFAAACAP